MAIATAPRAGTMPAAGDTKTEVRGTRQVRYTWNVLDVRQIGRMESVDYQWAQDYPAAVDINGKPIEASTATGRSNAETPTAPLSLTILHDRWDGLIHGSNGDASELLDRLDGVLSALADGMLRRECQDEYWEDGEPISVDTVSGIDTLEEAIRDWFCRPEIARIAR